MMCLPCSSQTTTAQLNDSKEQSPHLTVHQSDLLGWGVPLLGPLNILIFHTVYAYTDTWVISHTLYFKVVAYWQT